MISEKVKKNIMVNGIKCSREVKQYNKYTLLLANSIRDIIVNS